MRVLHVVGDSKFGGEALVIRHLAALAMSLGWEADVLTTDPQAQQFYREHGIGVVALDAIRRPVNPFRDLAGLWKLWRFLRAHGYDVVHTHTSKGGVIGRLAARLAGVPAIVHTVHGFAFHEESSRMALRLYPAIERFAARCCDRIVTVSQFHRRWAVALRIAPPEKIMAIPNGISEPGAALLAGDARACRAALDLGPDELLILSTSRLAPQKGLEYLIRAIPRIKETFRGSFRILLAGSGELESDLRSLCQRLGVEQHVLFLGFRKDIGPLLQAADIVALPSLWEGLSISLLEAMLAAKAIIATSIGSNLEALSDGQSGLVVSPKDPDALADGLVRLLKNPRLREALGAQALAVVRKKFSIQQMTEGYRHLYLELASAARPGCGADDPAN